MNSPNQIKKFRIEKIICLVIYWNKHLKPLTRKSEHLYLHRANIHMNCTLFYNLTNPRLIENHNGPFIHQHKLANQSQLSEQIYYRIKALS